MVKQDPQEKNFERALEELEEVVEQLESGELGSLLQSKTHGGGEEDRAAGQRQGRKDAVQGARRGGAPRRG